MQQDPCERERYLGRLVAQLFAAHSELVQLDASEDGKRYSEILSTVYRLKEEYRRHTGLYPSLPPYDASPPSPPGT